MYRQVDLLGIQIEYSFKTRSTYKYIRKGLFSISWGRGFVRIMCAAVCLFWLAGIPLPLLVHALLVLCVFSFNLSGMRLK